MNKLDMCLDGTGNNRFFILYSKLIREYAETTNFSAREVACIFMAYHKFVLANGPKCRYMTKKQFFVILINLFNIYDHWIVDRILLTITNSDAYVLPKAWMSLIKVFFSDDFDERLKFVFRVYNPDGNDYLRREVVTGYVEKFFVGEDEDEVSELRSDMLEYIFKKFDVNRDDNISFEEYSTVVQKQPALIEFLGQVFPTDYYLHMAAVSLSIASHIDKFYQ